MAVTEQVSVITDISYGYVSLVEAFCKANELDVTLSSVGFTRPKVQVTYKKGSDTEFQLSFMSTKHLGLNNMLCDFVMRCGIPAMQVQIGQIGVKSATDEDVDEHLRRIGVKK